MKYRNFEDLPVWNAAIEFALKLFEFTAAADFRGIGDLKNQIERAAVSISNNIAEGFERGTNNDLIHFLYISGFGGRMPVYAADLRTFEQILRFQI